MQRGFQTMISELELDIANYEPLGRQNTGPASGIPKSTGSASQRQRSQGGTNPELRFTGKRGGY